MKTEFIQADEQASKTCVETDSSLNRSDCQRQSQLSHGKPMKKRIGPYSFHLSDVIGRGFSSVVYHGIRDNDKMQQVALKVVALEGMSAHRRLLLENQVKILKMIDHPNIVPLIDIYYTVNNCYIIMEYCEGGSLQSLVDTKISIDWPRAAYQIGAACQYLASHRVIHRDIKPANVLVRGGTFKLADFGFAYELSFIDEIIEQKYLIGSPLYMSPESLVNNMYSKKGDAFAFGVFLYYLATRRFPWKGKDKHELIEHYEKRRASQRPLHLLPPKLKHYINGLLERNMELRLSIFDIDIEIFPRVRDASNIQEQLGKLATSYLYQIKICQFLHFLMQNYRQWEQMNAFLPSMMSQHLGQLVQIFGWQRQTHMNQLKQNYRLPPGQFAFSNDEYHWLNNCLKDTISVFSSSLPEYYSQGIVLKLLQYQQLTQGLIYGKTQEICEIIESLTLHESFENLHPQAQEIDHLISRVDFYQL